MQEFKAVSFGELLVELRKPGKVYVKAIAQADLLLVQVVKSDLIRRYKDANPAAMTGWSMDRWSDGTLFLSRALDS